MRKNIYIYIYIIHAIFYKLLYLQKYMENKLDIQFYKLFYLDIYNLNLNDNQILEHFKNFGLYEKRFPSKEYFYKYYLNFDTEVYKIFNEDLQNFCEIDLMRHYHFYGIHEDRIISLKDFYHKNPDFDVNVYKNNNKKVNEFTEISIIKHYLNFGKNEFKNKLEKKNNENLSFYLYKKFNPDSISLSNKLIEIEYINSKKSNNIFKHKIGTLVDFYNIFPDFNYEIYNCFKDFKSDICNIKLSKNKIENLISNNNNNFKIDKKSELNIDIKKYNSNKNNKKTFKNKVSKLNYDNFEKNNILDFDINFYNKKKEKENIKSFLKIDNNTENLINEKNIKFKNNK